MRYEWIDEYLLVKKGVTKDLQPDWNWVRYHVGGKMFAAICLDDGGKPVYITLKLEPAEGEFWRGQYEDVVPGYYMNKVHWISIILDGSMAREDICRLIEDSHALTAPKVRNRRKSDDNEQ